MNRSPISQAITERIQDWSAQADAAVCRIRFDEEFPGFAGHFPGHPIVPGVCLAAVLDVMLRRLASPTLALSRLQREKFTGLVRPGDTCQFQLILTRRDDAVQADFSGTKDGSPVCKLRAFFQEHHP